MTVLELIESLKKTQAFLEGVTVWGLGQPEGAPDLHDTKQTVKQLIEHHLSIPQIDPVKQLKDLVGPSGLVSRGPFNYSVATDAMSIEFKDGKAIVTGSWQGHVVWTETIDYHPGQNLGFAEILIIRDITKG